jgi:peptidoglycan DL-endopeptidase CwlO
MNTLAYLFIFTAVILMRAVSRGRAANVMEDLSDAFLAAIRGDSNGLREVANRTGTSTTAPVVQSTQSSRGESAFANGTAGAIGQNAVRLGSLAKGYRLGATGPTYYDCSGLMWQACKAARAYTGIRFTTATLHLSKQFTEVTEPMLDDIVVWRNHHMGVVTGKDKFYSAMNSHDGIGYATISTWASGKQGTPRYYRANTVQRGSSGQGAGGGGGSSW